MNEGPAQSTAPVSSTAARDNLAAENTDGNGKPETPHNPLKGAIFMTIAVICMTLLDVSGKYLVDHYPIQQIQIFRGIFALIPLSYLIYRTGGVRALRFPNPTVHVLRAFCGLGAMVTFFLSLQYLTLIDATSIGMASPILIAFMAIPLLGERVGLHRWFAIALGMVGILVMLRPSPEGLAEPAALLPLAAAFFYAMIQILSRKYAGSETPQALGVSYNLIIITVGIPICLIWGWEMPRVEDLPAIVGVGMAGGLMMIFMIKAYQLAEASFISALDYTALIWAAFFGWLFWREVPDSFTLVGAAIVVSAGLYILHRETKKSKQ